MTRFARHSRVYFVEEPIFGGLEARLSVSVCPATGVRVVTPMLPQHNEGRGSSTLLHSLVQRLLKDDKIDDFIAWYYTPMALEFTSALNPSLTIYDCMDELSAFANAPAALLENERMLYKKADLVFTGGVSLFEAKRSQHERVHLFPSSVDVAHFSKALRIKEDPADQQPIPRPRIGYVGVIDERMDLGLLDYLAESRPNWQIVLLGPVVKIDPSTLPHRANIHYLGMKKYDELPAYLSSWDVALLPFAQNDATRFISPTKTPEYLAAGLPVVSTPIRDVIRPYGELGLVRIGKDPAAFLRCVEQQLLEGCRPEWQSQVRTYLSKYSWDKTWESMEKLMGQESSRKNGSLGDKPVAAAATLLASKVSAPRV